MIQEAERQLNNQSSFGPNAGRIPSSNNQDLPPMKPGGVEQPDSYVMLSDGTRDGFNQDA